jgi:hypothetical protein
VKLPRLGALGNQPWTDYAGRRCAATPSPRGARPPLPTPPVLEHAERMLAAQTPSSA